MAKLKYLGILTAVLLITITVGALFSQQIMNHATISARENLAVYISYDGINWVLCPDGYALNWTTVEPDETYYVDLAIKNIGNTNCNVSFNVIMNQTMINQGWTQKWMDGTTPLTTARIDIGQWLNGTTLDLYVPSNALDGDYIWPIDINAEKV